MWIFLSNSYLSIVRHRDQPDHLLVRARNKGDIEAVFPYAFVETTPTGDYLFRAVISESEVADVIKKSVLDIDYDNFKNSIHNSRFYSACLKVWFTMNNYQRTVSLPDGIYHAEKKKD